MMHSKRRFVVVDVPSAEELARMLVDHTWCGCNGFRLGDYLYLNDSTSPDGAGEFAVVREYDRVQVESITFSWCTVDRALEYIQRINAHEFKSHLATIRNVIEAPEEHETCSHCA